MGIFQKITTSLKDFFTNNKANNQTPGYKMNLTDNTFEAKKQRDAVLDQRPYNIEDAHSWNPETHPEGIGSSYLVQDINYDPNTQNLDVTYRDGFTARYDDMPLSMVKDFVSADSKGRWAHKHLFNRPYTGV